MLNIGKTFLLVAAAALLITERATSQVSAETAE
jgi:hypothetical protein